MVQCLLTHSVPHQNGAHFVCLHIPDLEGEFTILTLTVSVNRAEACLQAAANLSEIVDALHREADAYNPANPE